MLCINPTQLTELMKWVHKHVRHRCCGSVCLHIFNQEARTREKETQQTKDETSIVSKGQLKQRTSFQTAHNRVAL